MWDMCVCGKHSTTALQMKIVHSIALHGSINAFQTVYLFHIATELDSNLQKKPVNASQAIHISFLQELDLGWDYFLSLLFSSFIEGITERNRREPQVKHYQIYPLLPYYTIESLLILIIKHQVEQKKMVWKKGFVYSQLKNSREQPKTSIKEISLGEEDLVMSIRCQTS